MATEEDTDSGVEESGSTSFFDNICQPCEGDGKILEAEGRCEDCDEYLCKPCFLGHTLPSKMRHHVMIGKKQLYTGGTQNRKDQCTQKCPQHSDEIIKYYCPSHSFLGCSACMILNHSGCSGNIYIPEVAKDALVSEAYNNYKASKSVVEIKAQEITTDAKERMETFKTCQTTVVEKLRMFKQEVIDLFEIAEKEIIEISEDMTEEELKKLESIVDQSGAVAKDIRATTTPVEHLESKKQYCNIYIELMKAKDSLKSCESILGELDHRSEPHREIHFLPNHNVIAELLSSRGIGAIKDGITQLKHERDINVKTQSDTKTCWITDSFMLPGNKMIITDYLNHKLKLIDTRQDKVVEVLSMSSAPWGVTATGSNEVAVTLSLKKKIAFVKTDGRLVNHRNIDVDGDCCGIACMENTLVVTFDDLPKVEVMDLKGVVLRNKAMADERGANLREPLYVVVSSVNKAFYIPDVLGANAICLTSDGTLKSTYTDANLDQPTGMAVDSFGNVYVCDRKKHCIHQITKDCKKKRIFLTEKGVSQPYAISYCETEDRLYKGMLGNNTVDVFKAIHV